MTTARQVPALVATHTDYLRTHDYTRYAGKFLQSMATDDPASKYAKGFPKAKLTQVGRVWCDDQINRLRLSQLFHISESMTVVSRVAAEQVPRDETWSAEILPAMNGVLVFEKPLVMLDIWNRPLTAASVTWSRSLPGEKPGIRLATYSDVTSTLDAYNSLSGTWDNEELRRTGPWSLAHYSMVTDGEKIGTWVQATDERYRAFAARYRDRAKDRDLRVNGESPPPLVDDLVSPGEMLSANLNRLLYAIFLMMQQTVVSTSETWTDRRAARMAHKRKSTPPMVSVIRLRREEQFGEHSEQTGGFLTYRSVTRGHWRRQHYGPNRGSIKRIWVNAYMRGDPELPLWQPHRVSTLAR